MKKGFLRDDIVGFQEQYHDEQTSKQSNIQTSYKESQQAKQERPAVKSDFSSPKVERHQQ
ncbi:hypothetical protein EfmJHP36_26320 [Enterococcus faecium]|nr:hypothetical protein EfmJHP36_26320 [Enterococcus faecium]